MRADALSALLNLGYQRSAAEKAIDAALGEGGDITVESILRRSSQETRTGLKTTWPPESISARVKDTLASDEDRQFDLTLRPTRIDEYIGQRQVKENLRVYMKAARGRREALDHVLLTGPPGLGKTTLANIIANEMGAELRSTAGPAIEKAGDIAALLTNLQEGDVLFIDEIHRLLPALEEKLYPAMEDYQLDLLIGQGAAARSIKLELPKFTLDRRHDSRRSDHRSFARTFRHRLSSRLLPARRSRSHLQTFR